MEAIKLKGKINEQGILSIYQDKLNLRPGDVELLILYPEQFPANEINTHEKNTFLSVIGKGKINKEENITSKKIDRIIYGE